MKKLKVIIFEDTQLIREALYAIINASEDFECVAAFSDCMQLTEKIKSYDPQLILMDIEMPGMNGIEATKIISQKFPEKRVLIQTVFNDSEKIFHAICAGASGYILKTDPPQKLLEALKEAHNGGAPMSATIAKKVWQFFSRKNVILVAPDQSVEPLSERELIILKEMQEGAQLKAIAASQYISYETVRTHVKNIYRKLHVSSRAEAIMKASQQGIS
jgi:DNA-binding NarL/FixJ family response regulator